MGSSTRGSVSLGSDWVDAAGDLAANGVTMLRRLAEAVGTLTVVAAVAIAMVPSVRESAVQMVQDAFASAPDGAEPAQAEGSDADREMHLAGLHGVRLQPSEVSVAQYLSRRYRVAEDAVRPLVLAAREAGRETQLDPHLILAVMAVESSMNPFAESPVGAQGLMQVMTAVHSGRFGLGPEPGNALEPSVNIRMGSAILGDLVHRGGSLERGLQLYVGAGNLPDDGGYASRVLSEMARLKTAAAGDVAAALAAGLRADGRTMSGATTPSGPAPGQAASPAAAS